MKQTYVCLFCGFANKREEAFVYHAVNFHYDQPMIVELLRMNLDTQTEVGRRRALRAAIMTYRRLVEKCPGKVMYLSCPYCSVKFDTMRTQQLHMVKLHNNETCLHMELIRTRPKETTKHREARLRRSIEENLKKRSV